MKYINLLNVILTLFILLGWGFFDVKPSSILIVVWAVHFIFINLDKYFKGDLT